MTIPVCKPLLPVYDKPLIYYPLSVLMQAGIRETLIIVPPGEIPSFFALLGDGSELGIRLRYEVQPVARGIADALLIAEDFLGGDSVCLVLGDNIFHSPTLPQALKRAAAQEKGATIFGYYVDDPRPFGVVEFDGEGRAISIEEKPREPRSNYIVPGLYFYDRQVISIARGLKPSQRGELEITDVNLEYLRQGSLRVIPLAQDLKWLDAGTADSLLTAAQTIRDLQDEGRYVACLEELARDEGWISTAAVHAIGRRMETTNYGKYLMSL